MAIKSKSSNNAYRDGWDRIFKDKQPEKKYFGPNIDCPSCGAPPSEQEVRNYDAMWGDGDVWCKKCNSFVRNWDRD